jgi:ABC-type transport system substrate-binding protein
VIGTGVELDPDPERGRAKALAIRRAVSLAYDAKRWIKVMRNGTWGIPARGPLPPDIDGYVDEFSPYAVRDLERARKILADAGMPGGKGVPKFTYEMTGADSTSRQGSEIVKDAFKELGLELDLQVQTWSKFMEMVNNKRAQVFGLAWVADYPDAQNFLQLFYGPNESPGPNNANYHNAEYDRLYDKMKLMLPGPERNEVIREMLVVLYEDCPWSFTDHRIKYSYFHSWLHNYKYNDFEPWAFKYYRVDQGAKAAWKNGRSAR